ncbi:MAG: SDR family oxidoreductase [Chloroflexota bacterium]|nr:SDR family oxidoreductase [Chloroflexota bacterium]
MSSFVERLFSLGGKTALLTGASGGIGQVLAGALADAGATVGVHGRDLGRVRIACDMVEQAGQKAVPLVADVADVDACRHLVDDLVAATGRLDILINCAATNRRKPISEVTEEDWEIITAVNLRSVFFLSQAAHAIMRSQGGGKIIHVGSINITFALDTVSVYGASKGGMAQLTKAMAVEWAPDNIQINCISPGFMLTPLSRPLWQDEEKARWFRQRIPARRPGNPSDLVGVTLLLASNASSYITGQNIIIDGGFEAGGSWLRDIDA